MVLQGSCIHACYATYASPATSHDQRALLGDAADHASHVSNAARHTVWRGRHLQRQGPWGQLPPAKEAPRWGLPEPFTELRTAHMPLTEVLAWCADWSWPLPLLRLLLLPLCNGRTIRTQNPHLNGCTLLLGHLQRPRPRAAPPGPGRPPGRSS